LCQLSGESCVKLRFHAYCGYGGADAYFALDNIRVSDGTGDDLEPILIYPPSGGACSGFPANQTIGLMIQNNTCRPLTDVPVQVDITGAVTATLNDVIPGPVPRFGRYYFLLDAGTVDMSAAGTYNFSASTQSNPAGQYLSLINDTFPANDTRTETRLNGRINTFPHTANFNASNDHWASYPLAAQVNNYFRHDAVPYLAGAAGKGNSWYLDVTGNTWTDTWVESPEYDFTGILNPILYFDAMFNLNGHPVWQYVRVEYSDNGGAWTVLGGTSDPLWYNYSGYYWYGNQPQWKTYQHSLCHLANKSCVKFRVSAYVGYGGADAYFAFDNFTIKNGPDVGVIAYTEPVDLGCLFDVQQKVTVRVHNWSCTEAVNVDITCAVTGQITTTLFGTVPSIPTESSVLYTFPDKFDMTSTGIYNFDSHTALTGDLKTENDDWQTSINVNRLKVASFDYSENFNPNNGIWVVSNADADKKWTWGTLPLTYLGGDEGKGNSWYLEYNGSTSERDIYLESPVFDFREITNPILYFDAKWNLDGSTSWQ